MKTAILRQKLNIKRQAKNILLESLKIYANKVKKHAVIITASQLADLKKSQSADEFNNKFIKKYKFIEKLHLDSKAFKNSECSHVRYRSTSNRIAKLLNAKLITSYETKKIKKVAHKKSKKVTAKK